MPAAPSTRSRVFAVLNETARSVQSLDAPVLRAVLPVLERAQREVQRDLTLWLAHEGGGVSFTAQRYRNSLVVLNRALKGAKGRLRIVTEGALKGSYAPAAMLSLKNLEREWNALGAIFEGTTQPLAIDEAAAIASSRSLMWPRYEASARRYAGNIGERTRLELAVSRARSETMDELVNRLRKNLPDIFDGERYQAERLARTETMSAYSQTSIDAIGQAKEEDPELVIRWDSAHDFRLCPACRSLDGKTVKVGEKFTAVWTTFSKKTGRMRTHSLTVDGSPLHPNCRCTCGAWRESWARYDRRRIFEREMAQAA